MTLTGAALASWSLDGQPAGIALAPSGDLYVGDVEHGRVLIIGAAGTSKGLLGAAGSFSNPCDIAVDPSSGLVFVADAGKGVVRRFEASGTELAPLQMPGGSPTGVALLPGSTTAYVADAAAGVIKVFGANGSLQLTIAAFGGKPGNLTRPAGLAVTPSGRVFVADAHQGTVAVFDAKGSFEGTIGSWGQTAGKLNLPIDVAIDSAGRLLVTSAENGRVEAFALPGAVPLLCAGDTDCDGMPDSWEVAHGLNPKDAADAASDADGDGLNALAEYAGGTLPLIADTDGDGVKDGTEKAKGLNPLNGNDNIPVAVATVAAQVDPSKLVLDGSASTDPNMDPLAWAWTSANGAASVKLADPSAAKTWTVVKAAGQYGFDLVVSDGQVNSTPAHANVNVANVPPTADAGPEQSVLLGAKVTLEGRFSSDANGDVLSYQWQQVAGPAATLIGADSASPSFVAAKAGTLVFALSVSDGKLTSLPVKTFVVAGDSANSVPVAAVSAVFEAVAGATVVLDGTASSDLETKSLTYAWKQLAGPAVALTGPAAAAPTFAPKTAGLYEFQLEVSDGTHVSPPVRATVLVDDSIAGPARAVATPVVEGNALDQLALDGTGSFAPGNAKVSCNWTQVEGVRVPIIGANDCMASFVPIEAGVYVFEMKANSLFGPGNAARVVAIVNDPGVNSVPVAQLAGPAPGVVPGQQVMISADTSFDPDGTGLHYLWTQVAGPRIPLAEAHLVNLDVTPPTIGLYAFDLRVDDGTTRSAPVRLSFYAGNGDAPVDGGGADAGGADAGGSDAGEADAGGADAGGTDAGSADVLNSDAAADAASDVQTDDAAGADVDAKPAVPGATDSAGEPSDSGCSAGGLPSHRGAWLTTLIAALVLLMIRRNRRAHVPAGLPGFAAVVALTLAAAWPTRALASDAPHNAANLVNVCEDCHLGHNTLGTALTSNASNQNLCLNCHTLKGLNWAGGDQAVPGVSGTSHRWDAALNNAAYGATTPTDPLLAKHLDTAGNAMLCSTCHDQHSQTKGAADPFAAATPGAAGRHFMRMDNNASQLCLACHSARNIQDATTYTGAKLSHPVGLAAPANAMFNSPPTDTNGVAQMDAKQGTATAGTTTTLTNPAGAFTGLVGKWVRFTSGANKNATRQISAVTATQLTWATGLPTAIAAGVTYRIDNDGNPTNNMVLNNGGTPSFTTGQVMCLSCHAVHYADSNSATHDGAPGGVGDGMLLRRTNDDTACTGCHKLKLHNSTETSTQYGTWGGSFTCRTCHDTHDSKNIYLLRESIVTPNSGTKAVDFRNIDGKADYSFATVSLPGNGICEVCHTKTKNGDGTARFRNTGGSDGGKHYPGSCIGCHSHADGFKFRESNGNVDCLSCHNYNMDIGSVTRTTTYHHVLETGANLTAGVTTYPTAAAPTVATANKDKACVQCHADHNVFRADINTSNTLGRGASLRSRIANGPPAGNPAAVAAPGDAPLGYFTNKDYDATFAGKGICLSCHTTLQAKNTVDQKSDGTTVTPAIGAANYALSKHAYAIAGQYTNGSSAFNVDCVKCHSDGGLTALQNGANKFALHASVDRSLRNPLGQTAPHDAAEEDFCFRCHHKTTDSNPGGGPAKGVTLKDYYNAATMTAASEAVYTQFQNGRTTVTTSTGNQLYFKPVAAATPIEPMPNAQATDPISGTLSTTTLYLRSALDGPATATPKPAAWLNASGTYAGTTTFAQNSMMPTAGTTEQLITQATINTSTRYYRLTQFVSPAVAAATTLTAGTAVTLYTRASESSASQNLRIRYALYKWTAANALGGTVVPVAQYATELTTTAANQTIPFNIGTTTTFNVGDKLILEVEFSTTTPTATGTGSFYFGNATSNARLVLPAALNFGTTGPAGGTWVGRAMSTGTTAVANETQSTVAEAVGAGTNAWRRVSFTSPGVGAAVTIPAANWTITVNAYQSSANANARVRYRLASWTAADAEGTVIKDWTTDTQAWSTTAPGTALTIVVPGAQVTLAKGDSLVLDLEAATTSVVTGGNYTLGYVFGATAAGNLLAPATLTFTQTSSAAGTSHAVYKYSGLHRASATDETLAYIAANKHVECEDCHNPHEAKAGVHALKTNLVSGSLTGVSGAVATWGTTTNWSTASAYTLGTATKEYEVCFKCHSSANTALATWNSTWTDVAKDFSPKNRSIHPVTVGLSDASRTNATAPKPLLATQMLAAWNSVGTQTMYCSDCHGEGVSTPAAQGPHGSAVAFMLKGTNTKWPQNSSGALAALGATTGVFCLNCHVAPTSSNGVHSKGDHAGVACVNCHVLVPHGSGMSRLMGDADSANMPTRMAYQGVKTNTWLTSFTKASTPTGYSKSNCQSTTGGCTTHKTAASENW